MQVFLRVVMKDKSHQLYRNPFKHLIWRHLLTEVLDCSGILYWVGVRTEEKEVDNLCWFGSKDFYL